MDNQLNIIIQTVQQYISNNALLSKEKKYLVALSGGADSVAMLRLLVCLGYNVEAVHCNFRLRGAESDRDETFVRSLCKSLNIPCHVVHFDTREYAALHKQSIEMAARNLRYSYFEQLRKDIDAEAICVAHHREDSVETVLINLIRGTGLSGLCGIRPINGRIIRPLLCISRQDIETYLGLIHQDYVIDSTNLEADVVRNKIRLNIMPLLRDINPSVDMSIWSTAQRIAEVSKVFDEAIDKSIAEVVTTKEHTTYISISSLLKQTSPEYVFFKIMGNYGFSSQQIENMFANINASTGKIYSSDSYDAVFDRGQLLIEPCQPSLHSLRIPEEGNYIYTDTQRLSVRRIAINEDFKVSKDAFIATLDATNIQFPLTLRPYQNGDRFIPFGMKGGKLVSDYLTDKKKSLFQKRRQLVVVDANQNILWLIGERTDNRYRISPDTSEAYVLAWNNQ